MIRIIHGIYENNMPTYQNPVYRNTNKQIKNIPAKIVKLLNQKRFKFDEKLKLKNRVLEFTYGYDEDSGISSVAVVHPLDYFNKRVGREIVKGRIKNAMIGRYGWKSFDDLPVYVNVSNLTNNAWLFLIWLHQRKRFFGW